MNRDAERTIQDLTPLWDAGTYERVADPQAAWAREIIARSGISDGDVVLDAGCGGGRVTQMLLELTPNVIAVDADEAMVAKARETLPASVPVLHQDLLELELDERVDVVFSCAVFHWRGMRPCSTPAAEAGESRSCCSTGCQTGGWSPSTPPHRWSRPPAHRSAIV